MGRAGTTDEWNRRRLLACKMIDEGLDAARIARLLECDPQTVRAWRRVYRRSNDDPQALVAAKPSGTKRKLSTGQRHELLELLRREPRHYGLDAWLWTTKLIAELIKLKFGVAHHHDHVGHMLRELGWSYQVPARRASRA